MTASTVSTAVGSWRRGGVLEIGHDGNSLSREVAISSIASSWPGTIKSVKKPCIWPGDPEAVDGHARGLQGVGVRLALVAQHVVLGGQHDGRREAGEVGGPQRRGVGFGPAGGVREVVVPEPHHRVPRQHQLVLLGGVGGVVEVGVGDRVDQRLERDRRTATVARPLGHDRRQVAAGRVTADDDRHVAPGDVGEVGVDPLEGGVGVVDGDRVAVLRRQAVVDEHDGAAGPRGELAAEGVELVEVAADDPAATVVVDEHATRRIQRDEDPRRDLAAVDRDRRVLDARHVRSGAVELAEAGREGRGPPPGCSRGSASRPAPPSP